MSHVRIEVEDGIAEWVLDRPKVNAMSTRVLAEMRDTFTALAADEGVKGVLVRGGGSCLSAGLDLRQLSTLSEQDIDPFLDVFDEAFIAPFVFPKPMAVAVHGHAIAGGMVLALCADHLVWGKGSYKIGLTELAVGVPFPRVAWEIVRGSMGPQPLRRYVNGAATHTPDEVFASGVGDALVEDPVAEARRWLSVACARPLATFRLVKAEFRGEAWQRISRRSIHERSQLRAAILATREQLTSALA
jgi:enoyl-CoA hydratase